MDAFNIHAIVFNAPFKIILGMLKILFVKLVDFSCTSQIFCRLSETKYCSVVRSIFITKPCDNLMGVCASQSTTKSYHLNIILCYNYSVVRQNSVEI